MKITNFQSALEYLKAHMPVNTGTLYPGKQGLERTKYLLELAGNPQNNVKSIHIAGTSGKSSTSYLMSLLLKSQGFKTGLLISPHITDIRERIRIDNDFITREKFVSLLQEMQPLIEQTTKTKYGTPTSFEIITALAFYFFNKESVDYAVIETGLGGLLDATNVIERKDKLSIITKLGYDHTEILGKTILEIALQKSGIINNESIVVTVDQDPDAIRVLENSAKYKNAKLYIVKKGINYRNIEEDSYGVTFDFEFMDLLVNKLKLSLMGGYQAENCSLALAALNILSGRDRFSLIIEKIRGTSKNVYFPGRSNRLRKNGKNIIVDGAHNTQKMQSFISTVKQLFPGKKFDFLVAFTNTKNYKEMIELIVPAAKSITITSFKIDTQDWIHISADPQEVNDMLYNMNFDNVYVINDPKQALRSLLQSKDKNDIIITGSFYLISVLNLYEKK